MLICFVAGSSQAELVGWWRFENNFLDSVNSAVGTAPNGGISFVNDPVRGNVIHVNGVNGTNDKTGSFVDMSAMLHYAGFDQQATVVFWVKFDSLSRTNGGHECFSNYSTTPMRLWASYAWNYYMGNSSITNGSYYGGAYYTPQPSDSIDAGEWHHLAFVYDMTGTAPWCLIYIDGVYKSYGCTVLGLNLTTVDHVRIGCMNTCTTLGSFDDVAWFNTALSASEIQDIYLHGLPIVYWALNPTPSNGATDVDNPITLSWQTGPNAVSHDVYLGTNEIMVRDANINDSDIFVGNRTVANIPVSALSPDTTYYWRVDERNNDSTVSRGAVWRFTTKRYLIDDFESYANDAALQAKWVSTNATRTIEKQITHNYSGQAMQLDYNTSTNPYYSKVVYTFTNSQNWTVNGLKILAVYFHGSTNNTAEQLYVTLEDLSGHTATVIYSYPEDLIQSDLTPRWNEWNINLQNFAAGGVILASVKKITIGVGDSTPGGSSGTIYIDDVRLYQQRCVEEYAPAGDFNGDCKADINDVLILAQDWLLKGDGSITSASPNSNGLVAYYTFNETSGSTAADSSGHSYTATVSSPSWNTQGKYAGCLNFSGDYNTGAVVLIPDSVFNSITNQITISLWVNADTSYSENMTIFDSNNNDDGLWPLPKWESTIGFEADGEGAYWPKAQPQDYKAAWHHYAVVKDADNGIQRLFRDGELVAENRNAAILPAGIKNFIVGRSFTADTRYGTDVFVGKLDDLRIYNYALSHSEVLNLSQVSSFHQHVLSDADAYEDSTNEIIDFKDFSALAKKWLQLQLWP